MAFSKATSRSPEEPLWTAEEFAQKRFDLPDGGRWMELVAGRPVAHAPPDERHGSVVLNLSKALAEYAQREHAGYACFELGLILARGPDTVRCPAVSYFTGGNLFAESDRDVTETRPTLVVEIASTNDRRANLAERVKAYLEWGVKSVWVIDTVDRSVHAFEAGKNPRRHPAHQRLYGTGDLSGFQTQVEDLFKEPSWWQAGKRNGA